MKAKAQPSSSEEKSRSAAHQSERHQTAPSSTPGSAAPASLVDNRSATVAQRRLQHLVHTSPPMVAQRQQMQRIGANPVQMQSPMDDEMLQGKFEPAQLQGMEEDELQMKAQGSPAQRQSPMEDEMLQGKFPGGDPAAQLEESAAPPVNRTGLPDSVKSGVENLSGLSMDDVQVHYNSSKPATLQALAYTQGSDIHVGPGQEQHVAHEAWHVAQQKQGRVQPTIHAAGTAINDDAGLEHEADVMGNKASQLKLEEN